MSKVILRKEIKELYLNTVLTIFIRQYRTQAGNHGNCCFIVIFENVLEYLLFEVFFFVLSWVDHFPLDWSIHDVMIATQNNDSTIGRWKTEPKQDNLFLARNCRGCKLPPPAQTNKQRRSEENKGRFRPKILEWNFEYSMWRMEQYLPVGLNQAVLVHHVPIFARKYEINRGIKKWRTLCLFYLL